MQPPAGVSVDAANPLVVSGGIKGLWSAVNMGFNSASGINGVLTNGATTTPTDKGVAFSFDGVDDYVSLGTDRRLESSTTKIVAFARVRRTAALVDFSGILNSGKDSASQGGWILVGIATGALRFYVSLTGGSGWVSATTAVTNVNQWYDVCGTWDGVNIRVYLDGVLQATTTCAAIVYPAAVSEPASIGRYSTTEWPGQIALAAYGEGLWTAGLVKRATDNPWQLFQPLTRRIFVIAAAGGVSLQGILASVATATGVTTINVPIAGSAAAVASASGAVSITVNLSTAALAVAAATGAITVGTQLSGSASAVATDTGALSINVPLSGSAAAVATDTGALSITVLMSGAAVATAAATGTLTTGTLISGGAEGVASASGVISVNVPLSGSATATANVAGGLGVIVPVSGAAASVSSATGALSVSGTIALAAIAQAVATGAGTISVTVPLQGAALAQASAYAAFAGLGTSPEIRLRRVLGMNRIRSASR